jgi:hypothetical protein
VSTNSNGRAAAAAASGADITNGNWCQGPPEFILLQAKLATSRLSRASAQHGFQHWLVDTCDTTNAPRSAKVSCNRVRNLPLSTLFTEAAEVKVDALKVEADGLLSQWNSTQARVKKIQAAVAVNIKYLEHRMQKEAVL